MDENIDFDSLYFNLEKTELSYKQPYDISRMFQLIRDRKIKENDADEVRRAQWEVDAFNFTLKDGEVSPLYIIGDGNGETIEYPILSKLDNQAFDYFIFRLNYTENPCLKSRYAHILSVGTKDHGKYGQIAVDSYMELANYYEQNIVNNQDNSFDLVDSLKNSYFIARKINDESRLRIIKSKINSTIIKFSLRYDFAFSLWVPLVELMLIDRKIFTKYYFIGLENKCCAVGKNFLRNGNIFAAINLFVLGERIEQRFGTSAYDWRRNIAECYEILMSKANGKGNLASLDYCQQALQNYKQISDKDKIEFLEKKYAELKSSILLRCSKYEVDITDYIKYCNEISDNIVDKGAEEIIKFLISYSDLMPKFSDQEKMSEDMMEQYPIVYIFPEIELDDRGNTVEIFSTKEEHKRHQILKNYDLAIQIKTIPLLNMILLKGINNKFLSAEDFIEFFKKYSWFGKILTRKYPNGKTHEHNWLSLVAPSLIEYFNQAQYVLTSNNDFNLILPIDSMTLKLEGLMRDFCEINGIPTFYQLRDKAGRNITREKDINALLHDPRTKDLLGEDDVLFLKFLLVEKAGCNLRHKIAHSLMVYPAYSLNIMNLLILALLKLSKYDFIPKGAT